MTKSRTTAPKRSARPTRTAIVQDGWANALTGLGGALDKTTATEFEQEVSLPTTTLRGIYDSDWLCRRIVDLPVDRAFARGIETTSEAALAGFNAINYTDRFATGAIQTALKAGRLTGGAAIILGCRSSAPVNAPLPPNAELMWLDVADRGQLNTVTRIDDPARGDHGSIEVYRIVGDHPRNGLEIHASRVILCEGLPSFDRLSGNMGPIGFPRWVSVVQPVYAAIAEYGMSWKAVSTLLQEASIGVMSMGGLIDMLSQESQSAIQTRIALLSQSRSVARTVLLDSEANETFTRTAVSFADLPQLMREINTRIAGIVGFPATVIFGQSPSGLNANGDADQKQFESLIATYQEVSLKRKLERILQLIDPEATVEFPCMSEPTDKEDAETRLLLAQADQIWYANTALEADEIRAGRIADGSFDLEFDPSRGPEPQGKPPAEDYGEGADE